MDKVVKALLSLSHGNAGPERGFSVNKKIYSADRTCLSSLSVNALRSVQDTIRLSGGIMQVSITPATLTAVRGASAAYRERIQREKQKMEQEQQQQDAKKLAEEQKAKMKEEETKKVAELAQMKKTLAEEDKQVNDGMRTVELMLENANSNLQQAIKAKDLQKVEVAQAMLLAANKKLQLAKANAIKRDSLVQTALKVSHNESRQSSSHRGARSLPGSSTTVGSKFKTCVSNSEPHSLKRSRTVNQKSVCKHNEPDRKRSKSDCKK